MPSLSVQSLVELLTFVFPVFSGITVMTDGGECFVLRMRHVEVSAVVITLGILLTTFLEERNIFGGTEKEAFGFAGALFFLAACSKTPTPKN